MSKTYHFVVCLFFLLVTPFWFVLFFSFKYLYELEWYYYNDYKFHNIFRIIEVFIRTYVFHLLRTYIILLCNWLILWQNTLYLFLGRSRMCLILQEMCCSSLVLNSWRLDQETSEKKLFIKAGQIARHMRTDSLTLLDSWWIDWESSRLLDSSLIASQ